MTEERPSAFAASMLFRAAPIVLAVAFAVAVGSLVLLVWRGGEATGARVAMTFEGDCPSVGWRDIVFDRATDVGLGHPTLEASGSKVTVTATLPGLPDDRTAIPALLARGGSIELTLNEQRLASRRDLVSAALSVDEAGQPYTLLTFTPEATSRIAESGDGHDMTTLLDGEPRATWQSEETLKDNTVRLLEGGADNRERMRKAADDAIVLSNGPLPCVIRVVAVE